MASRFIQQKEARRSNETKPGSFGLSSKPESRNTPPADNRPDRAALASGLKVGKKDKQSMSHQNLANVPPQPRHQSPSAAGRNTYQNFQNPRYQPENQQPQTQPAHQPAEMGDVFNDTVTTGFDQTKSDLVVENDVPFSQQQLQQVAQHDYRQNEKDYEYDEDRDFDDQTMHGNIGVNPPEAPVSPRQLHRKRSQDQLNPLQQDMARNHPIDNRFHNSQRPNSHPSLQIRPGYEENVSHQQAKPNKRSRENDPLRDATNHPSRHQQQPLEEEEEEDQALYRDLRGLGNGDRALGLFDEQNNFERANGVDSDSQLESPRRLPDSQGQGYFNQQEFEASIPDYNDEKLKSMKYSDLKKESWEANLKARPDGFSEELVSSDVTLEEKIEMILHEKDENCRISFFAGMPADEWNEAGDHIMAKMTELMKKLKDARTRKRQLVEGFEAVYEAREEAVRGKSENFDAKLEDMKTSGEGVLRGKV